MQVFMGSSWDASGLSCEIDLPSTAGLKFVLDRYEGVRIFDAKFSSVVDPFFANGVDLVKLRGGVFMMGSNSGNEAPIHRVRVRGFAIARTETTVGQYARCVAEGACAKPKVRSKYGNWGIHGRENHPVISVNWFQARDFCKWAKARLPTEAEWEFAARSRGSKSFPWGEAKPSCKRVVMNEGSSTTLKDRTGCGRLGTWPVCSKPRGHSAQGVCDLIGNASEWVFDWHLPYPSTHQDNPKQAQPKHSSWRVVRGGSAGIHRKDLRATRRLLGPPKSRLGFRCAR